MNQEERDELRAKHQYAGYNGEGCYFQCKTCGPMDSVKCEVVQMLDDWECDSPNPDCKHTDLFGKSWSARLYDYSYCPDCGAELEPECGIDHETFKNARRFYEEGSRLVYFSAKYCPECSEEL
jgi:hypothetical protein